MTQRHEIEAWLGDDHGLTGEQIDQLVAISDQIATRYPDPDGADERDAALSAVHQAMVGDPARVVAEWAGERARARLAEVRALAGLQALAGLLVEPGDAAARGLTTQAGFAAAAGVTRMAVRDWLGLRR